MKCMECGNDMGDMEAYVRDMDAGSKVETKEVGCPECGTIFSLRKGEDGNTLISMIEESRPQKTAEEEDASKDPTVDGKIVMMDPNNERNKPYEGMEGSLVWTPGDNK